MQEAASEMEEIMQCEVTPAQLGAFVTALRIKGETADEITGLASVMRAKAIRVTVGERIGSLTVKLALTWRALVHRTIRRGSLADPSVRP